MSEHDSDRQETSRRRFLQGAGIGAAALTVGGLAVACGDDDGGGGGGDGGGGGGDGGSGLPDGVVLGYVTPRTGDLAPFGEADDFVLGQMREQLSDVEILDRDSETTRAADVAQELINEGVNLMLVSSTPDTTVPVAQACDVAGVPCISTVAPWQAHYLNIGGALPDGPLASDYNFHFFWGLEGIVEVFIDMWEQSGAEKVVGALWPNDPDGEAWSDANVGFPPALEAAGFEVVDPGRFPLGTNDFSAQIGQFRDGGVEIVTGVLPPPDFANFQAQALQQGFEPPVVTVGKALLFPSAVESYPQGAGLTSEVWWTNRHPYTSSLTGQSCEELATAFEESTGAQWTQPLGFAHALFEVAVDALTRAGATDADALIGALGETDLASIVGPVNFSTGPVPNVTTTQLVGGQWVEGGEYPLELTIVANTQIPEVQVDAEVQPIQY